MLQGIKAANVGPQRRSRSGNVCCRNLSGLRQELRKAKARLGHKRHIILGYVRQPGSLRLVVYAEVSN